MIDAKSEIGPVCSSPKFEQKFVSSEKALSLVKSGDTVFVGTACATPRTLLAALEKKTQLNDVVLTHFLIGSAEFSSTDRLGSRFEHRVFFVGMDAKQQVAMKMRTTYRSRFLRLRHYFKTVT